MPRTDTDVALCHLADDLYVRGNGVSELYALLLECGVLDRLAEKENERAQKVFAEMVWAYKRHGVRQ